MITTLINHNTTVEFTKDRVWIDNEEKQIGQLPTYLRYEIEAIRKTNNQNK